MGTGSPTDLRPKSELSATDGEGRIQYLVKLPRSWIVTQHI